MRREPSMLREMVVVLVVVLVVVPAAALVQVSAWLLTSASHLPSQVLSENL
jgi:hypothetical protein